MIDVEGLLSAGVDIGRIESWMRSNGVCSGPVVWVRRLPGGSQNVLVHIEFDGRDAILRRPPTHKRTNSDKTMEREVEVLRALADTSVAHPRLIASCTDINVTGAAFYLMDRVVGTDIDTAISRAHDPLAAARAIGLSIAETAAQLASVKLPSATLDRLGHHENWLERQVGRWRTQLDTYAELDGYAGPDELGPVDEIGQWLQRHRPGSFSSGLVHGDFHLGNLVYSEDRPEVCAVVDWELATVGDPLLDLAHMLATWPDGRCAEAVRPVIPELPTDEEMIAWYVERVGRDVDDLAWYRVLACYRLGIILEGTKARADAGKAQREVGEHLHEVAVKLFDQARALSRL